MILPLIWFLAGYLVSGFVQRGLELRQVNMVECIAIIALVAIGCTGLYRKLDK